MRNGNLRCIIFNFDASSRSYRTYEEWKLLPNGSYTVCLIRSYRTYEEWKRFEREQFYALQNGSYRTYEEWKHNSWIDENA